MRLIRTPCTQPGTMSCLQNQEEPDMYGPGGFHRVSLGDKLNHQRYTVLRKIGYGQYSTVWLARDSKYVYLSKDGQPCTDCLLLECIHTLPLKYSDQTATMAATIYSNSKCSKPCHAYLSVPPIPAESTSRRFLITFIISDPTEIMFAWYLMFLGTISVSKRRNSSKAGYLSES